MYKILLITVISLTCSGCTSEFNSPQMTLNDGELKKVVQIQNPFGKNIVSLKTGDQEKIYLGMKDCNVYKSCMKNNIIYKWEKVKSKRLGSCMEQSISLKGKQVIVKTRTIIFGAGGGPLLSYRSKDGINWEECDDN